MIEAGGRVSYITEKLLGDVISVHEDRPTYFLVRYPCCRMILKLQYRCESGPFFCTRSPDIVWQPMRVLCYRRRRCKLQRKTSDGGLR